MKIAYWFRNDKTEMLRHLRLLQETERLAKLAGVNVRPKVDLTESKRYNTDEHS